MTINGTPAARHTGATCSSNATRVEVSLRLARSCKYRGPTPLGRAPTSPLAAAAASSPPAWGQSRIAYNPAIARTAYHDGFRAALLQRIRDAATLRPGTPAL